VQLVLKRRQRFRVFEQYVGVGGERIEARQRQRRSIQRPAIAAAYARGEPLPSVCLKDTAIIALGSLAE